MNTNYDKRISELEAITSKFSDLGIQGYLFNPESIKARKELLELYTKRILEIKKPG